MDRKALATHISSHSVFNVGANVARVVISGLVLIFVARQLGPEQFGIVSLTLSIATIVGLLCDFGITTSVARFLSQSNLPDLSVFKSGMLLNISFSFIFSALFFLLSKPIASLINIGSPIYLQAISIFIFFTSLFYFSIRCLQGIKRTDKVALLSFLQSLLTNLIIFPIVFLGYKATAVLFGYSGASVLIWIICIMIVWKYFDIFGSKEDPETLKKIFFYSLPLLLTSASYLLQLQGPVVLLNSFAGSSEVAYLNIPLRLVEIISLPAYSLSMVSSPFFSKNSQSDDEVKWLYIKGYKYLFLFYVPVAFYLAMASRRIIDVIFGPQYMNSANVLLVFAIYLPFFAIANFSGIVLDFRGKARSRSIVFAITTAIAIIASFFVIPSLKALGTALVIAIPYTIFSLYMLITSAYECNVMLSRYSGRILRLLLIISIACVLSIYILSLVKGLSGILLSLIVYVLLLFIGYIATKTLKLTELITLLRPGRS